MGRQPTTSAAAKPSKAKKSKPPTAIDRKDHRLGLEHLHSALMQPIAVKMLKTVSQCGGLPLVLQKKEPDGSHMVCYLQPDCTYSPWQIVHS
jgi:hypothetical protein